MANLLVVTRKGIFEAIPNVEAHGRASNVEHIFVIQGKTGLIVMIYKMFREIGFFKDARPCVSTSEFGILSFFN